jgi:acetyl esterase/lipase
MPSPLSWAFLTASLVAAWFTYNAFRPPSRPATWATICFFAGWLTVELAAHHLLWQFAAAASFIYYGALDHWPGWLALLVSVASWASLMRLHQRGALAADAAHGAVQGALSAYTEGGEALALTLDPAKDMPSLTPLRLRHYALPFQMKQRRVTAVRNRVFAEVGGRKLRADIYHREDRPTSAPVLVFAHGGGWVLGFKEFQALPMLNRMAAEGWVCVSVDYRLSPRATFPDHIADVNRGIAWAKEHAHEFGGDPSFVVVSGNSAGAHLAALAALAWDDPDFKPGFEDADTRVQAAVTFYGVYDLTNRFGHWPHRGIESLLESTVLKAKIVDAPERFEAASPIARVRADAPPWLVVHGTHDSLVPVEEARRFSAALREVSEAPVCYAEIPDAQHAFEIFRSVRGHHTLRAVRDFLNTVYARRKGLLDDGGDASSAAQRTLGDTPLSPGANGAATVSARPRAMLPDAVSS